MVITLFHRADNRFKAIKKAVPIICSETIDTAVPVNFDSVFP